MTRCVGFGQIIDTAIAVPGTVARDGAAVVGVISIAMASEATNTDAPLYERVNDTLIFSAPDVATYRCSSDRVEISPYSDADPEWVTALLIATALPATKWMQGQFMLHAAGIILKGSGHAIAIAGPSGSGKSTLVRQLLEEGARLVGDDSLALEVTDEGIISTGLPGGIHIRTGEGDDRCFEPIAAGQSALSAPLGAIIILGDRAKAFAHTKLGKTDAMEQIIANQHRPRIPAALGQVAAMLKQATVIAERIPVQVWRRQEGVEQLSALEREALT